MTDFFQQAAALNITGNLQLTISKGAENKLVVSVLLQNEQCGDNAKQLIPPLLLKGTAEELDNAFFESITRPVEQTSSLLLNMETWLKQQEEAKKQSAMEKDKADRDKKLKEERDKKYREAMQKADELEKEGKYRDAWMKLPDPAQFPEQAEAINKRRTALSAKFAPDLFGATSTPAVQEQLQEANTFVDETGVDELPDEAEDSEQL